MKIITKRLSGADAAELVNPFYAAHGAGAVARPDDLFFLAFAADGSRDTLVGAVRFCIEEHTPMLRSMMIHEKFRKRGIGHALLRDFETFLRDGEHRDTHCLPYAHLVEFYGLIGFERIDEATAPRFLVDRLAGYRKKNPQTHYICMRRT